ncbi:hypothetical protein B0H12DRAFT_1240559 [Mycena haematopus]|nr:hypothetical protein B0H12DRAFT_1240559 [Mycena haematopus]
MSASAVVPSPVDISAILGNPAALQTAVAQRLQANPTVTIPQLASFIESDATKARMIEEANRGLEAIHTVQDTFFRVVAPLARVDAGNFKGPDGKPIRKFASEWSRYFRNLLDNLNKTKQLAGAVRGSIDTFTQEILPLLANEDIVAAEKQRRIDDFLRLIEASETSICNVDTLVASYDSLSKNVTSFQAAFNQTMVQVGKQLDTDIVRAQQDIAEVKTRIAAHVEAGKTLGVTAGALGAVAAGFSATGILAPLALLFTGLAIFFGITKAQEYYEKTQRLQDELNTKESALATLNATKAMYNSLQPQVQSASKDMGVITVKLAALSTIFKTLKADVVGAKEHLIIAQGAHDLELGDARNAEIALAAASYANLKLILDTFVVGWRQ